ncbi:MAG TPA: amino acid permease [Vicinamibacterales bacterium]|nr:amino acid permease [Vicinamibacterales bacterium]
MNSERESLTRAIGTFGLAAGIVNVMIGGGIFRVPALVAASLGAAAPVAYVICAVAMGLIVMCIAAAGKRVTLTGGPYAYVGTALGPYAGFISGILLWMIGVFATAAVSSVMATSVGQLIPALSGRVMHAAVLVAAFGFWTWINMRGVTLGVRLNSVVTVAKLLPLLLIAVAGLLFIQPANLEVASWPPPADFARMALILVFAFAGIEVALIPSGEVRDPERTIPKSIALAMVSVTLLYIVLQVVAQGILGPALATSSVPLADAAGASLGAWARSLLLAGAAVSMFGHLGGMTLSIPRIVYALARDGYLPSSLAIVHPVLRTPQPAIVVQSLITLALAITSTFEQLAIIANVAALALYLGCAIAAWRLGQSPVVPILACGVIAWLLTGLTLDEWLAFGACVVAGSIVYAIRHKKVAA